MNRNFSSKSTQQTQNQKNKRIFFWIIVGSIIIFILISLVLFLKHKTTKDVFNPPSEQFERTSEGYIQSRADLSMELTRSGSQALRERRIKDAIDNYTTAISIYPLNSRAYGYLAEFFLKTGQEEDMFETLEKAGRSFPDFDQIIGIIQDKDLAKLPEDNPDENIFLANFPENKNMAVTFMFDDGEASVYTKALPIFEKYGFRATIPIVAGIVAKKDGDRYWGSWREWKDAADRGFEIANHSMFHRDHRELHGQDFDLSIDKAKELIEKNIGHDVITYVFPFDRYSDEAISRALRTHKSIRKPDFLRSIYKKSVVITYGGARFLADTANRLIDIGIKRHLWLIAGCHGVKAEGMLTFKSVPSSFLETNLSYIYSKSKNIWVDTFSKVFEYLSLRSHTKIEIKNSSKNSVDFILHNNTDKELSTPLTIVLKTPTGKNLKVAQAADGHMLKAWYCDFNKLCVDINTYDKNIHIEYK